MRLMRRSFFTRKRLLSAAVLVALVLCAGWFGARHFIARWAVHRALAAAGLEPATFQVRSVGLGAMEVANLSVGSEPWLTADSVVVGYTLAGIAARRVANIDVRNAKWTVRVREGAVDWGYVRKKAAGPLTLNLPCDRVDLRESVVRVVVDGKGREIPVAGELTPMATGGVSGRLDLVALNRAVTLTARMKTSGELLTVELEGRAGRPPGTREPGAAADAGSPAPEAQLNATLQRTIGSGATQIDLAIQLNSLAERAGSTEIAVSKATVTGHAGFDGGGKMTGLTASILAQGLLAGGLSVHSIELKAVQLDGPRLNLEGAASGEGWQIPGVHGTATLETDPAGEKGAHPAIVAVEMRTSDPVLLNWETSGITGVLGSVAGGVRIRVDGAALRVQEGSLTMSGGSLKSGDIDLSDGEIGVVMRSPEAADVTVLSAVVGDGGAIAAAPFTFNPREPRFQTRLSMTSLSLAEWLPLITKGHATGEGRISGQADVAIDLTTGGLRLGRLSAALRGDPQHGFVQATDAGAVGELLDTQDPRFSTDDVMRPLRDKIVSALRDFAFSALTVDVSPGEDGMVARVYLSGYGRHGDDPQGLNITLDVHLPNALGDLASRIAALSRNKAAARHALDLFFDPSAPEPAPEEAPP